ncbi:MAG: NAD(P)/FAD-dependent oxidoreductase, partial [Acidobacteria bacterium]|nr:NAD(P)/FAD-dependent oxidoreductase [Acidobacteriota bacterium]
MEFDAIVIGSGPNGLAAAITLAQAGCVVCVFEANSTIGGGVRSAELTLPGFTHDICSSIYPLSVASPFLKSLPLDKHGLEWIHPPAPLAHPFDDGTAAVLERSVSITAGHLGPDAKAYVRCFQNFVQRASDLIPEVLAPPHPPRHPALLARFGLKAIQSADGFARRNFSEKRARSLFIGIASHANLPMHIVPTAAFALLLGTLGHAVGWPMARGGARKLSEAMAANFTSLGGRIVTGQRITSLDQLPAARAILCDVTPRQMLQIAGDRLPPSYRRALERYRYGPGVFKVDWALRNPIPWKAAVCARAGTLHIGGTLEEISASERAVAEGKIPERPFIILAQHSLFDDTRAPRGMHTAWGYCHVPAGSSVDMTGPIETQIERFAPGFRDSILHRHTMSPAQMEAANANYVGGDIGGGMQNLRQIFARPALRLVPYSTPLPHLYI